MSLMDENSYYQNAMPSKLNSKIINQLDQIVRCIKLELWNGIGQRDLLNGGAPQHQGRRSADFFY